LKIKTFRTIAETAKETAEDIAGFIRENRNALLCLAAGDTPLPVFKTLIQMQENSEVDLSSVFYVGLDEWVGLDGQTEGSCAQVMNDCFYQPAGISNERICIWNGKFTDAEVERQRVEAWISAHGGIGLAMLGVGMNGHIGFNEPYTGLRSGTFVVPLDDTTKAVSVKYFKQPLPVEYGISIGAGELKKACKVLYIVTGSRKADIMKKVICEKLDEAVPASLFLDHPDITIYMDDDAAAKLDQK